MFVNGDAIGVVIKLLVAGMSLLCLALVSHVVWMGSLVRSRALGRFGPVARLALLALAAATPVVSFYCGMMVRHRAPHLRPAGKGRAMLVTVGAFAAVVLVLLAMAYLLQPGPPGSDALSRLAGLLLVLAVPCSIVGMACQVLVQSKQARVGLIVVAVGAAIGLFLLA